MSSRLRFTKAFLAFAVISIALLNLRFISWVPNERLSFLVEEESSQIMSPSRRKSSMTSQTQRPKFFLHIGPHKSATTSIQCALHESRSLLQEDNIEFLGKADLKFCSGPRVEQDSRFKEFDKCVLEGDGHTSCWRNITQTFRSYRDNYTTLILSKESLSAFTSKKHSAENERTMFWDRLAKSLRGWNVTVVMAYRHYFEWLPSAKFQLDYHYYLQSKGSWPTEPMPTLVSYVEGLLQNDPEIYHPYPYIDVMNDYNYPNGWNIHVLDLHHSNEHNGDDIVQDVLCSVLNAKVACERYQSSKPKRTSPANSLGYHSLNVQAKIWGWFSNGRPFPMMANTARQVEHVWNKTLSELPQQCLDRKHLEKLLSISLLYERRFHQNQNSQSIGKSSDHSSRSSPSTIQAADDHRSAFWKYARHFCVVDAEKALLQSPEWKSYYQGL